MRANVVQSLLDQILDLPAKAQTELFDTLLDMRAQQIGIYHVDDEERAALARSGEDVRSGRFASEAEIEAVVRRYRA